MSQEAFRNGPAIVGNTARALSFTEAELPAGFPAEEVAKPTRARTPLSLVVSSPRRHRGPIVVAFVLIVAALAAVLMMSVSLSKGQYELVSLKSEQSTLANSNQALALQISGKEAPQSLVAAAVAMGMVPASTTGQIDVRNKKVTGNPVPAVAGTKGLVVIPPADVNKAVPVAEVDIEEGLVPPAAAAEAVKEKEATASAVKQKAPAQNLNGGTIPSPTQKDS